MNDRAMRLAASLSFYTMLSIGPLLLITLRVVGLVLGPEAAAGHLYGYMVQVVGPRGAEVLQEIIAAAGTDEAGTLATLISLGILAFTASYVFAELQDAMNTVWNVETKEGWAVWRMIRNRLFAFSLVLSLAFLLLVSLVVSSVLAALTAFFLPPEVGILGQLLDFVVSLTVISLVFAALFKYVPDVQVQWRHVWPGALLTAVLFTIGQFALALYLGRTAALSVYGAAGSLVALLLWVYYSAMIVFFGAEFTKSYVDLRAGRLAAPESGTGTDAGARRP